MQTALEAYIQFKIAGDKDHIVNTGAKPRAGYFEAPNAGEGGSANFTTVERPYVSTSAFPWDNTSWYMD